MDSKQRNMAPMNIKVNPLGGAVCIVILLCMFLYMFGLPAWLSGHEERISMRQLLSAGIVLARRGGDRVRDIRRQNSLEEKVKGKTKEGANEMVSQGDLESHRAIVHGLSKVFPGLMVKKKYTLTLSSFSFFFFLLNFYSCIELLSRNLHIILTMGCCSVACISVDPGHQQDTVNLGNINVQIFPIMENTTKITQIMSYKNAIYCLSSEPCFNGILATKIALCYVKCVK